MAETLKLNPFPGEVRHLFDLFKAGALDADWIPAVAKDGWIVVTQDRGVNSKADESLPLICRAFKVSHIIFSAGLAKKNTYFKLTAFQTLWDEVMQASKSPPGSHFSMHLTGSGAKIKLVSIPTPDETPKVQQNFLP